MSPILLTLGIAIVAVYVFLGVKGLLSKRKAKEEYKESLKKSLAEINGRGAEIARKIDVLNHAPLIEELIMNEKLIQQYREQGQFAPPKGAHQKSVKA